MLINFLACIKLKALDPTSARIDKKPYWIQSDGERTIKNINTTEITLDERPNCDILILFECLVQPLHSNQVEEQCRPA